MGASYAAAMLDELMGRHRNLAPEEQPRAPHWDDPEVCRYFLVKYCPYELFTNTRADMGTCEKLHDDDLKAEFTSLPQHRKVAFEDELIKFCEDMLGDVERRIRKGKQGLALTQQEKSNLTPIQQEETEEKVILLTDKISSLIDEAEEAGCQGNVERAQGLLKLIDQLKDEKEELKSRLDGTIFMQIPDMMPGQQEKQMEVCEVCGAFLIVGDAQQRIDDHLMGKQHVGYARLRATLEEMLHQRRQYKESRE